MKEETFTRGAGILLAVSSLPSEYGIGTMGAEAYRFVDLLVDLKQRYWQVLPLGPTSFGDSPYQSFSAFAGNPYLIDLNQLVEDGLLSLEQIRGFNWGEDDKEIDYAMIFENRFQVLNIAFEHFDSQSTEFLKFCKEEDFWLDDYSLFMALKTFSGDKEWLMWEEGIRDRRPESLAEWKVRLAGQIDFWRFCQYEFFKQWRSLREYANSRGIEIIGDIPLYVALDSADVWVHRTYFQLDASGNPVNVAGCPPDAYAAEGQRWGNPIYDWGRMEESDFAWWRARMRVSASMYDVIKIDHFIGMVRYYSIPVKEMSAKNGKWNKGPGKKLTEVIQQTIGDSKIIAEDFGVSIPAVSKLIRKSGWPGMKVLIFGFDGGETANEHLPHNFTDTNIVVYAGTHDNDTIVGYYRDKTEYELAYLYEYLNINSKEEIPDAFIRLAYSSIADVVIIQMQDILKLGKEARMNQPSTVGKNWRWRVSKDPLDEARRTWIRTMATIYRR